MPFDPFAHLTPAQREQLATYETQLLRFNRQFNLISPDTESEVRERHVQHALALAVRAFPAGSVVVDWGTGGGLPAVPLAIRFPEVKMHAVDSVGKKVHAVRAAGRRIGVDNLHPWQGRAEAWPGTAHYSVSRATASLVDLWTWHVRVAVPLPPEVQLAVEAEPDAFWRPGLVCLKGGDLSDEIAALEAAFDEIQVVHLPLEDLYEAPYFRDKAIVSVVGPNTYSPSGKTGI